MIDIDVTDEQRSVAVEPDRLRAAIEAVFAGHDVRRGSISIAVVDDPTIHQLNRQYLQHDEPTDVLTFPLDEVPGTRGGEIIVSGETAARRAADFGWAPEDELLLYVLHGALHLVGYDDRTADGAAAMRQQETRYLRQFGLEHRYDEPDGRATMPRPTVGKGNES